MATKLQSKDILFCGSCAKPVTGEHIKVANKFGNTTKWVYHLTPRECADAPHIRKDWRRHGGTEGHNGFGADILGSDGHSGYPDNDMSMRFEGVESQDDIRD